MDILDNITGKFGNISEVACLSGGPQQRVAEQGKFERLMIGMKGKITGFKEKTEVGD